jgi:hypothetical protein
MWHLPQQWQLHAFFHHEVALRPHAEAQHHQQRRNHPYGQHQHRFQTEPTPVPHDHESKITCSKSGRIRSSRNSISSSTCRIHTISSRRSRRSSHNSRSGSNSCCVAAGKQGLLVDLRSKDEWHHLSFHFVSSYFVMNMH